MKLKGAEIIVETLIEQGCDTIFGYPGGAVLDIYDALYQRSDRIRHVMSAHEQGAAHAADGYFRATGKTGVVLATSGPGATNLVTGLATAMLDSVPVIAITGNVGTKLIGKDSFQEIDITGVTLPITKHNFFANHIEDLAEDIRLAFQIARSGRPGPVLIDVPKDVQNQLYDYEVQPKRKLFQVQWARQSLVEEAARLINECKRPYIYIGGGCLGAGLEDEVQKLADKIDGVIGSSMMGLSAVPSDNPRYLGMQGMHGHYESSKAQSEADLMICVGVRFSDRAAGNTKKFHENCRIIQLDADFSELGKNVPVDVGIYGDVHDAFLRIAEKVEPKKRPAWMERIQQLRAIGAAQVEKTQTEDHLSQKDVFDVINKVKDADTVIATDVGQHQMWAAQFADFQKPRKMVTSGGLGTMGFGMGAAIGASIGSGCRTVLITGDGSFGMNLNEMATAVSENVPLTIVLFDNRALGMVRQWQTIFYGKRYSSTTLDRKTDFVKLAEAFGAKGYRVDNKEAFARAFKEAYHMDGPALIDVVIDQDEMVLPMMPPGGSIDDIIVEMPGEERKTEEGKEAIR